MICKTEIRKTIDNSIEKATENDFWGFSKAKAQKVVNFLNELWGNIAKAVQSTGEGSYKIITSNLDEATDREYDKQIAAEGKFERDLDFFNNDEALYQQEQNAIEAVSYTHLTLPTKRIV